MRRDPTKEDSTAAEFWADLIGFGLKGDRAAATGSSVGTGQFIGGNRSDTDNHAEPVDCDSLQHPAFRKVNQSCAGQAGVGRYRDRERVIRERDVPGGRRAGSPVWGMRRRGCLLGGTDGRDSIPL